MLELCLKFSTSVMGHGFFRRVSLEEELDDLLIARQHVRAGSINCKGPTGKPRFHDIRGLSVEEILETPYRSGFGYVVAVT